MWWLHSLGHHYECQRFNVKSRTQVRKKNLSSYVRHLDLSWKSNGDLIKAKGHNQHEASAKFHLAALEKDLDLICSCMAVYKIHDTSKLLQEYYKLLIFKNPGNLGGSSWEAYIWLIRKLYFIVRVRHPSSHTSSARLRKDFVSVTPFDRLDGLSCNYCSQLQIMLTDSLSTMGQLEKDNNCLWWRCFLFCSESEYGLSELVYFVQFKFFYLCFIFCCLFGFWIRDVLIV